MEIYLKKLNWSRLIESKDSEFFYISPVDEETRLVTRIFSRIIELLRLTCSTKRFVIIWDTWKLHVDRRIRNNVKYFEITLRFLNQDFDFCNSEWICNFVEWCGVNATFFPDWTIFERGNWLRANNSKQSPKWRTVRVSSGELIRGRVPVWSGRWHKDRNYAKFFSIKQSWNVETG